MSHAETAPAPLPSRTRAVVARPLVSRRRTVMVASSLAVSVSALVRPAASRFPRGFSALTETVAGSTDSPAPDCCPAPPVTAIRSWL